MKKIAITLYGIIAYLIGLGGLSAFMIYMGSWSFLPIHINAGTADGNNLPAVIINLSLLLLFGLHHSFAARSSFKEKLAQLMPIETERSSYVLFSGLFMFAICLFWQPIEGTLWSIDNTVVAYILMTIHVIGWLIAVAATFEIDHFHLMGLKQSLFMNASDSDEIKERFLYRIVRHPIQTGVLLGVWFTPFMSMTQLMLAIGMSVYIFIGLYYEEKSLIAHFGSEYLDYKKRVPGLIPFWPTKG